MAKKGTTRELRLGKQEPRFRFILNPYEYVRCTTCPGCERKTKLRKIPLVIHVKPRDPVVLNKTCRYCPSCDILIAHQDEIEPLLKAIFAGQKEDLTSDDYLVIGTFDRDVWRRGCKEPLNTGEMIENLHDFKEFLKLEVEPGGWRKA